MLKKISAFAIDQEMLNGRPEGSRIREEIIKKLESDAADIVLPLDFSKVKSIDFSFADEVLCRLLRRILSGDLGERFVVLEGLNDSSKESLYMALKERELVCVFVKPSSEVEILGKISEELKNTYFAAVKKGKITTRDIFELDKMDNISAASNRLTRLKEMGLLTKAKDEVMTGGGRQYVYEPVR
jgi:DNA-binding transcriptional ArsR family regulator